MYGHELHAQILITINFNRDITEHNWTCIHIIQTLYTIKGLACSQQTCVKTRKEAK